jgi:hypothetical protein
LILGARKTALLGTHRFPGPGIKCDKFNACAATAAGALFRATIKVK